MTAIDTKYKHFIKHNFTVIRNLLNNKKYQENLRKLHQIICITNQSKTELVFEHDLAF